LITPVAKHALHNEPKTYTYHWTLPVGGDEKTYKGIEMYPLISTVINGSYENRSALEDVHSTSAPFGEFVKYLTLLYIRNLTTGDWRRKRSWEVR
jgi:hypothetical protein